MIRRHICLSLAGALCFAMASGCAGPKKVPQARPSIAPTEASAPAGSRALEGARAEPMYRELLAVDLPAVVGVAQASNIDIRQAKLNVEAAQGQSEVDERDANVRRARRDEWNPNESVAGIWRCRAKYESSRRLVNWRCVRWRRKHHFDDALRIRNVRQRRVATTRTNRQ